ncbi:MAG: hypothetical protein KUF72_20155 [Candidatus Thiodiazotropha sp. (ex Ctena orbiculata)]|nr:hypothetical protein [Candidatus Thiodiazotropha taylori]
MTLTTTLFLAMTGSVILLKIGLIAFALLLLVRGTMHASHPGSMDPSYAELPLEARLKGSYKP